MQVLRVKVPLQHTVKDRLHIHCVYLAPPYVPVWISSQPTVGLRYAHKIIAVIPSEDN